MMHTTVKLLSLIGRFSLVRQDPYKSMLSLSIPINHEHHDVFHTDFLKLNTVRYQIPFQHRFDSELMGSFAGNGSRVNFLQLFTG